MLVFFSIEKKSVNNKYKITLNERKISINEWKNEWMDEWLIIIEINMNFNACVKMNIQRLGAHLTNKKTAVFKYIGVKWKIGRGERRGQRTMAKYH